MSIRSGIELVRPATVTAGGGGAKIEQFEITDISESDILGCKRYLDGTLDDLLVWIAKPWFLRGDVTWEGQLREDITYAYDTGTNQGAQEREASLAEKTEDQRIVPKYVVGDRIMAARVSTDVTLPAPSEDFVGWLDLNVDGRMWAAV